MQAHLGSWDKQNPHGCRVGEYFPSIKDRIMQRDGKDAKTECLGTFQQLMRGVIDGVFGIIKRVNVQIDFDPFCTLTLTRAHAVLVLEA